MKKKFINVMVPEVVMEQLLDNRDRVNAKWSISDYLEHIITMHASVLERLEAERGK